MLLRLVERRGVGKLVQLAVDHRAYEAFLAETRDFGGVVALLVAHRRRQHGKARSFGEGQHAVDHLRNGLGKDALTTLPAVDLAGPRPKEAQVIVDFGNGADARARIAATRFLLDGDGRRESVDGVDVRFAPLFQELSSVRRERLDIASLSFGVDGIEGQRRLTRARQAGEHDQLVARDFHVDVLEVVLARAFDDDLLHGRNAGRYPVWSGANSTAQPRTLTDGARPYRAKHMPRRRWVTVARDAPEASKSDASHDPQVGGAAVDVAERDGCRRNGGLSRAGRRRLKRKVAAAGHGIAALNLSYQADEWCG